MVHQSLKIEGFQRQAFDTPHDIQVAQDGTPALASIATCCRYRAWDRQMDPHHSCGKTRLRYQPRPVHLQPRWAFRAWNSTWESSVSPYGSLFSLSLSAFSPSLFLLPLISLSFPKVVGVAKEERAKTRNAFYLPRMCQVFEVQTLCLHNTSHQ